MNNEWKDIPIFPGWKITGKLGSGSSSQVYSIEMEQEGVRIVAAMKILSLSADVKERTWKELEMLKILKEEKGVVSFDEYQVANNQNDESGYVLLRMEKMISLLEYSKGKVFTEKEIIEIGLELCRALAVCHEKGILHRDIKPSNLLFSKEQICLGDFSEAVLEGRIQQYQIPELKRKPEACTYMAPEYYKKGEYDKRSDLYSLGLVLYELLSGGRVPFLKKEGKMAEVLKKRMTGEKIPGIKSVSPEMNCIIDKLLAYEPENRYQTTVQLETDLEHCLQRSSENNGRICQSLQPDESTLKIQGRERQEESEQDWKRDLAKDMLWGSAMFIISVLIMLGVTGIWSQKEQQIVSQVETEPQNICESTDWEKIQQTKVEDIVTASTENVTEIPNEVTEHVPTVETEKGEIGKNAEEVKEMKESTTEPVKRAKKQERITEYRTKDENMDEEYTGHILRQPDEVRKTEKTATEESKEDLFEEENDIFK